MMSPLSSLPPLLPCLPRMMHMNVERLHMRLRLGHRGVSLLYDPATLTLDLHLTAILGVQSVRHYLLLLASITPMLQSLSIAP